MRRPRATQGGGHQDRGSLAGTIFFILAGPILWAGHLLLIYGPQSTICAFGLPADGSAMWIVTALVIVVTLAFLVMLAIALLRVHSLAKLLGIMMAERRDYEFAVSISRLLTGLSILGVAWAGAVALGMDPCAQLR